MKHASGPSPPFVVKRGSVQVKIYTVIRKSGVQTGERFYQVADYSSGVRRLVSFSVLNEAKIAAERVASQLARGETYAAGFRAEDRAAFSRATELLKPLGVTVDAAVSEYLEAVKLLAGRRENLINAARFYSQRNPPTLTAITVEVAANELIESKKARGASDRYLQDLKSRLGRFGASFKTDVNNLTTPQLQKWLESLHLSQQSLKNYRTVLHVFFRFCGTRGYVQRGFNPAAETEAIKVRPTDIEIFTPHEFRDLLKSADEEYRVCLALQGFAGLRSNEVERMTWSDIDLPNRIIIVSKGVAKTASRRTIPICDPLAEWLALSQSKSKSGKIWSGTHDQFYDGQQACASDAKVKWKHNGLRHSYASYRFALLPDAGRVAAELGHSPTILHKHYRELAKRDIAEDWFKLFPKVAATAST